MNNGETAPVHHPQMSNILNRLKQLGTSASERIHVGKERAQDWTKTHVTERTLHEQTEDVSRYIEGFNNKWFTTQAHLIKTYRTFEENGGGNEAEKESLQMLLTGYLFSCNRKMFASEKGSMEAYDMLKERRQIEGVLRALKGNHLHMGTGEGKTSVIIPIASLVEAVTSDRHDVVVSSSNWTLLGELKGFTEKYSQALAQLDPFKTGATCVEARRDAPKMSKNDALRTTYEQEVIRDGKPSPATLEAIRKSCWDDRFKQLQQEQPLDYLQKRVGDGAKIPRISFAAEKDLVFKYMENKKAFHEGCPRIFMDEADVPYNRNTPYQNVSEDLSASPQEIMDSTSEWLLNYMVASQIKPGDIVDSKGSYDLSDEAASRLEHFNIKRIEQNLQKNSLTYSWAGSFTNGLNQIVKQRGITFKNADERRSFNMRMLKNIKELFGLDSPNMQAHQSLKGYMGAVGTHISNMMKEKEKGFTVGKDGRVIIRDSYIDELMEEHKYDRHMQLAALAVTGKFEVLDRQLAYKTVRFPSFVNAVADQLTCFSGTLMYPDPLTGKIKKGALAGFLETLTKRKVALVSPPESKEVPRPVLRATEQDARQAIEDALFSPKNDPDKPTLVIDFNGLESTIATYKQLVARYGDEKLVALLPPKPSGDENEEKEYKANLDRITRSLANGEIRAIVSSGSAGTGINITKADGSFPDLRVAMLGMPQTEQQLVQAIGRRRMKNIAGKTRFFWAVGQDTLDHFINMYDEQKKKFYLHLGESDMSRQQVAAQLEKINDDPDKLLKKMIVFLHKGQEQGKENEFASVEYDAFYDGVATMCEGELKKRLRTEVLQIPSGRVLTPKENEQLEILNSVMGLPASLYWDILAERSFNFRSETYPNFNTPELNRLNILKQHILAGFPPGSPVNLGWHGTDRSPLSDWLNDWYGTSIDSVRSFVDQVYGDYFKLGFNEVGTTKAQMVQMLPVAPQFASQMVPLDSFPEGAPVPQFRPVGYPGEGNSPMCTLAVKTPNGSMYQPMTVQGNRMYMLPMTAGVHYSTQLVEFPSNLLNDAPVYFFYLNYQ